MLRPDLVSHLRSQSMDDDLNDIVFLRGVSSTTFDGRLPLNLVSNSSKTVMSFTALTAAVLVEPPMTVIIASRSHLFIDNR